MYLPFSELVKCEKRLMHANALQASERSQWRGLTRSVTKISFL